MAQETLNIVITADNKEAIASINQTIQSTNTLGESLKKMPDVTGKATLALGNLSRIAQDAPYGFMGIANNLNPMLESFQRLQTEAKGSGNALKAMASALAGPAGVGLAVGVVSSLIVKYGDAISELIFKSTDFEKAQSKMRDAIGESTKTSTESIAKNEALLSVVNNLNESTVNRERALKQLKEQYKGNIELQQTDINDGEKLTKVIDNISTALLRKAQIDAFAKLIAEEQAKITRAQISTIEEQVDKVNAWTKALNMVVGSFSSFGKAGADIALSNINSGLENNQKEIKTSTNLVDLFTESLKKLTAESINANDKGILSNTADKVKKAKEPFDWQTAIQKRAVNAGGILTDPGGTDTAIRDEEKKHEEYLKWLSKWTKDKERIVKENYKEEQKILEKQMKQYEDFAKVVSGTVTDGLVTMYDAMQKGQNPLQALGDFFAKIAEQIAAAIVQALIFEALMNAFPELKGAFAAIGGVVNVAKHAEGGITTGPSIGMIGEAGPEAIMPLSKLGNMMNNTFHAGAMKGNSNNGSAQFVLRGQDLLVALNRTQKTSNLKGQNISLI